MPVPRMLRVRQTFARPRVPDIPRAVADALAGARLPVTRGDTVAVGAGSRGIANIDVVVGATVRYLRDLGARPFVFPAMGSHGGGTADGQLDVLAHYGITEATMGCPVRATMDVVPPLAAARHRVTACSQSSGPSSMPGRQWKWRSIRPWPPRPRAADRRSPDRSRCRTPTGRWHRHDRRRHRWSGASRRGCRSPSASRHPARRRRT